MKKNEGLNRKKNSPIPGDCWISPFSFESCQEKGPVKHLKNNDFLLEIEKFICEKTVSSSGMQLNIKNYYKIRPIRGNVHLFKLSKLCLKLQNELITNWGINLYYFYFSIYLGYNQDRILKSLASRELAYKNFEKFHYWSPQILKKFRNIPHLYSGFNWEWTHNSFKKGNFRKSFDWPANIHSPTSAFHASIFAPR